MCCHVLLLPPLLLLLTPTHLLVYLQIAGMRPAPIRFGDQVPDGGLAVAQRDVLAPSKAVAVSQYTKLPLDGCLLGWQLVVGCQSVKAHVLTIIGGCDCHWLHLGTLTHAPLPCSFCSSASVFLSVCLHPLPLPHHTQVQDEDGWIAFFPGPFANITFGVDHTKIAPVIGSMWHTWHSDDEHFRWVCAVWCVAAFSSHLQVAFGKRGRGVDKDEEPTRAFC